MKESAVIVIPARMASTRYPNKPLAQIHGKSMIERVWRIGQAVEGAARVVIATDDERLRDVAQAFGAETVMTSSNCVTGTDRVAEAARLLEDKHTIFFSLQGDAVLTPPWVIEVVLQTMLHDPTIQMATPALLLEGQARADFLSLKKTGSTSGATVTFDKKGNALYFSKVLIPYPRDESTPIYRHIGLYGYRGEMLQKLNSFPEGPLEKAEKLEQLRALENGIPIRVIPVDYRGRTHGSVDRPEDVAIVEKLILQEGELIS